VAVGIARVANLCLPLVESIALAHDCGHGPAGHASARAFSPYLPGTGYDHAVYGADVTLASLNLCLETLDGVRNHSWRRPAPATPEGEVVAWADRIAYVCHDFEDAVRARILTPDDLPPEVRDVVGDHRPDQVGTFVNAVLDAVDRTGEVGRAGPAAPALAPFRGAGRGPSGPRSATPSPGGGGGGCPSRRRRPSPRSVTSTSSGSTCDLP